MDGGDGGTTHPSTASKHAASTLSCWIADSGGQPASTPMFRHAGFSNQPLYTHISLQLLSHPTCLHGSVCMWSECLGAGKTKTRTATFVPLCIDTRQPLIGPEHCLRSRKPPLRHNSIVSDVAWLQTHAHAHTHTHTAAQSAMR